MGDRLLPVASTGERGVDDPLTLPPLNIPAILNQYNLHPDKKLGQNFLVDGQALKQVVSAAELTPESTVLEV